MAPHFSLAPSRSGQEGGGSCGCTGKCRFLQPAMKGRYPEAFVGGNPLDKMGGKAGDMELVKAAGFLRHELLPAHDYRRCRAGQKTGPAWSLVIAAGRMGRRRTWAGRFGRTDSKNC